MAEYNGCELRKLGSRSTSLPLNIVLAEDNPRNVTLVDLALTRAGLNSTLHILCDGEQAMAFIESLGQDPRLPAIDLVLLDLNLPKLDGEEVLKRLRATGRSAQTPVVVMTGSGAARDYERVRRHGGVHYFHKPFSLAEYMSLGGIVRDILFPKKDVRGETSGNSVVLGEIG